MPEMPNFTSNPGASGWITTAPGPGIVRHGVKSQKRHQLLSEAATLTPDQQELVKQLTDRELSPADAALYGSQLSEGLKTFAGKYNDNPFYAFSREGKETVSGLQRLVRDPHLIASERAFKQSEEDFKKVRDSHLTGLVDVNNDGRIKVIRRDDDSIEEILPENFNPEIHQGATVENLYQHKVGKLGFYNKDVSKIQPYSHAMEDPDKVIDQVNKWFTNLGTTGTEQMNQILSTKTTSNAAQVNARLQALYDKTGLSQQARNTLYSQYYTDALQSGQKPTRQGAEEALVKSLGRIAEGYNVFKQDVSASPLGAEMRANAKQADEKLTTASTWEFDASNVANSGHTLPIKVQGRNIAWQYTPIDRDLLQESVAYHTDENTKKNVPNMNVKDSKIFNKIDQQDMYIMDLKSGNMVPMPEALRPFMGEVVMDSSFLGAGFTKPGKDGVRHFAGDDRAKTDQMDRTFITKAKFQGNRGGNYDEAEKALDALGYATEGMSTSEQEEYESHVNNPDYENSGWGERDKYEFNIAGVYRDPRIMNSLTGQPVGFKSKINDLAPNAMQGGAIDEIPYGTNKVKAEFRSFDQM